MWGFQFLLYNPIRPAEPPHTETLRLSQGKDQKYKVCLWLSLTFPIFLPHWGCSSGPRTRQEAKVAERFIFSLPHMSSGPHSVSMQEGGNQIWFAFAYVPSGHIALAHVS